MLVAAAMEEGLEAAVVAAEMAAAVTVKAPVAKVVVAERAPEKVAVAATGCSSASRGAHAAPRSRSSGRDRRDQVFGTSFKVNSQERAGKV